MDDDDDSPNQTSSAEMVESNQDLLTQVLLYFSVKSLLKSKCVSKRWLSIISDPQFPAKYTCLHVNIGPSGLYFYGSPFGFLNFDTNQNMLKVPSLSFLNVSGIEILQSCNGLLLLLCSFSSQYNNNSSGFTYCVRNPTTKNFVTVPLPNATANRSIAGISLAFDPSKSTRYKVICVLMNNMQFPDLNEIEHLVSPTYQIEIFSSETKAWALSGDPFEAPHYTDFEHGVFCNGAIHWLSPTDVSLYFDVQTERLETMPMPRIQTGGPSGFWSSQRFPYFGQCSGHLHLVEVDSISKPRFHVLEMKSDYSCWHIKYYVNLNNVASDFPEIARRYMDEYPNLAMNNPEEFRVQYYAYSILSVVRGGEKEDDVEVVMLIPGKIISHNPRLNTSRLLSSWRTNNVYDCMQYKWYHVCQYVESLASL